MFRELGSAETVMLEDMLSFRDNKAQTIKMLCKDYNRPVVSFALNIAGEIKSFALSRAVFFDAVHRISFSISNANISIIFETVKLDKCSDVAYFVIDADAVQVKRLMLEIEKHDTAGRLYDIDVYEKNAAPVSRNQLGLESRKCLICNAAAHECARSRRHSYEEIMDVTLNILKKNFASIIGNLALKAMLTELDTYPKPGLVTPFSCGAHKDMDYALMKKSANAIAPYFNEICYNALMYDGEVKDLLKTLRPIGLRAEKAMYEATSGINTHKGMIFSLGIFCAAAGYLISCNEEINDNIFEVCSEIAQISMDDFSLNGNSSGSCHAFAAKGARYEAANGFPNVRYSGYETLKNSLKNGLSVNDSSVTALLKIMTKATDTNIMRRSSPACLEKMQNEAIRILQLKDINEIIKSAYELDKRFVSNNISPGGCADLLAASWFVYYLYNAVKNDV